MCELSHPKIPCICGQFSVYLEALYFDGLMLRYHAFFSMHGIVQRAARSLLGIFNQATLRKHWESPWESPQLGAQLVNHGLYEAS